jgi:steroid delta-isomerase-like uncharacterized protein
MSDENKALVRRWFEEVWNKGNADAINELFAADGIAHGLSDESGEPLRGPAHFKVFHDTFRKAFPDIVVTVEDTISEGDKVAARCTVRGQHAGEGLRIAASNKPIEISGMTIVRIRDGQIIEGWNNFDFMNLYKQIGAI